jgi:Na+/melibiose symporter-like transporter
MVARFWDIFTDPVMGIVVDRFPSRWGKRKHWIVVGIPILMLASWYVFIPGDGQQSSLYLLSWLFVLYLSYTFVSLTQQAWGVDLTSKYNERSTVYGWREMGSIFGMMAVLAFPAILELLDYDFSSMIAGMGYFLIISLPLTALVGLLIIPDDTTSKGTLFPKIRDFIPIIKGNGPLKRTLAAEIMCSTAASIAGSTYIYLARYVFEPAIEAAVLHIISAASVRFRGPFPFIIGIKSLILGKRVPLDVVSSGIINNPTSAVKGRDIIKKYPIPAIIELKS